MTAQSDGSRGDAHEDRRGDDSDARGAAIGSASATSPLPATQYWDAELDAIAGAFIDAAAGFIEWRSACDRLATAFRLLAVHVLAIDTRSGAALFSMGGGPIAPQAWFEYLTKYHTINPRSQLAMNLAPGQWIHDHEHFDDEFVARHPFYADFLIPYGARYMSATKLVDEPDCAVMLSLHRAGVEQPLDTRDLSRLQALLPHFVRALKIHLSKRKAAGTVRLADAMLDLLPYAVVLVDGARTIHYRNAAARAMLDRSSPVVERAGLLLGRSSQDDHAIAKLVGSLGLTTETPPEPWRRRPAIRIGAAHAQHVVFGICVRPDTSMRAFGEVPYALLVVHDAQTPRSVDPSILTLAFDLTPAEAMVAVGLAEGGTVESVAKARSASVNTVRAQLRSAFAKVGVNRQADLVRVLLDVPGWIVKS